MILQKGVKSETEITFSIVQFFEMLLCDGSDFFVCDARDFRRDDLFSFLLSIYKKGTSNNVPFC